MHRILSRAALTALEATIAVTIFAGVMTAIIGALQSGSQMQTSIQTTDNAGDKVARALRDVASELRYADINKIYLDGTAWTSVQSGSDYYSFKVCSGWDVVDNSTSSSFNRLLRYDRGIVLRFSPTGNNEATLYRTVMGLDANGVPVSTLEKERPVAVGLCWEYEPTAGAAKRRGFDIIQLDPTQASVVGNRLQVRACAYVGSTPSTVTGQRPWRAVETAVYLRSSMFDSAGLSAPVITQPKAPESGQPAPVSYGNVGKAYIYDVVATNDPTRYAVSGLPPGLSYNAFTGRISGTPTTEGTYTPVVVSAFNDAGSGANSLTITIKGPPPTITSVRAINVLAGGLISYQITADGSPTGFGALNLPAWLTCNSSGLITGAAPSTITTTTGFFATITATNANGITEEILSIQVSPQPPKPPVVTSTGPLVFIIGQTGSYKLQATDNPTAWYGLSLPPWLTLEKATGILSGKSDFNGSWPVYVQAANEVGLGSPKMVYVTVQAPLPIITSALNLTAREGEELVYDIVAANMATPGTPAYKMSGQPVWLSLNATSGRIAGTPPVDAPSSVSLTITAVNTLGSTDATLNIAIEPLLPPTFTVQSPITGTVGSAFSAPNLSVSPLPSKVPTTFASSGLPPGVTLGTTGAFSGAPTAAGEYVATINVTNAAGTSSAQTSISIKEASGAPVVSLTGDTASGTTFQATGTITPGGTATTKLKAKDFPTFTSTTGGLTMTTTWVNPTGTGANKKADSANLVITGTLIGSTTITISVENTDGKITTYKRVY